MSFASACLDDGQENLWPSESANSTCLYPQKKSHVLYVISVGRTLFLSASSHAYCKPCLENCQSFRALAYVHATNRSDKQHHCMCLVCKITQIGLLGASKSLGSLLHRHALYTMPVLDPAVAWSHRQQAYSQHLIAHHAMFHCIINLDCASAFKLHSKPGRPKGIKPAGKGIRDILHLSHSQVL